MPEVVVLGGVDLRGWNGGGSDGSAAGTSAIGQLDEFGVSGVGACRGGSGGSAVVPEVVEVMVQVFRGLFLLVSRNYCFRSVMDDSVIHQSFVSGFIRPVLEFSKWKYPAPPCRRRPVARRRIKARCGCGYVMHLD